MSLGVPQLYQPHTLPQALGQSNALRQNIVKANYQPQMIQNQLALEKAQAKYFEDRGKYYDESGNLKQTQSENQQNGYGGNTGQGFLLAQKILADPNSSPQEKAAAQALMTRIGAFGLGNVPTNTPSGQAFSSGALQQMFDINPTASPFNALNTTPKETYQDWTQQYGATTAEKQAGAARDIAEAESLTAGAVNKGYPSEYGLNTTPTAANSAQQTIAQQQGPTPPGNFIDWQPDQQSQYIATHDAPPPLPPGASAITEKVDPRTETRIGGLAPTAETLTYIQREINDPLVTPYIGKDAAGYIERAQAQLKRVGTIDPGYAKYLALKENTNAFLADMVASTQTGSRGSGVMQQFQKAIGFDHVIDLQQANMAIQQAGDILYDEGVAYIGGSYDPGLRQNAFNGVKLLQTAGFGTPVSQDQTTSQAQKLQQNLDEIDIQLGNKSPSSASTSQSSKPLVYNLETGTFQ